MSFRFSEKSCSRFVPVLKDLLFRRPESIEIDGKNWDLRAATIVGRFRDAILAYTKGELECPFAADLRKVWKDYEIIIIDEYVALIRKKNLKKLDSITGSIDVKLSVNEPTDRLLDAILIVVSERVIPSITISTSKPVALEVKASALDLIIEANSDGTYTIC